MSAWRPLVLWLAAAIAVAGCGTEQPDDVAAWPACDVVAAPDMPVGPASARQLVEVLEPGETGCLRRGTYDTDEVIRISTPDVTLTSYPGEHATIVGRLLIEVGGSGATIENLDLDGRNPDDLPSPTVNASDVTLAGNDISNDNTAICVHVNDYGDVPIPEGLVIEENRIHDCGRLPATNRDHGIYLAKARGTVIRDNWIYDNADRGIQLYPDADGTMIIGNVIDGNGEGIIFSGDGDSHSDDSLVEGNLITNSTMRYNVESHWQGPVGSGNLVRNNCAHGGARDDGEGGIQSPAEGFVAEGNIVADPGYLDPDAGNFTLTEDSPCASILGDASAPQGRSSVRRLVHRLP